MREKTRTGLLLLIALPLLVSGPLAKSSESPNIVVILADDLGYSDIGSFGGEIRTPTLDRLARDGIRFTQMYSTGRCWPSRASLLTGYYAQQVNMDPWIRRGDDNWPKWTRLLPEYLQSAGYRSYHSGKWHLRKSAVTHGFKHSYLVQDLDRFFNPQKHSLDDEPLDPIERGTDYYTTVAIVDRAISFLQEHQLEAANKPFFVYIGFTAPHFPLQALPEDIDKYRGAFSKGWDQHRKQRVARMRKLGLVNRRQLSRRYEDVTAPWSLSPQELQATVDPGEVGRAIPWKSLSEQQKKFEAGKMEVHAAMVDRMDQEIARVITQVAAMGATDNTVVIYLSDNGASAEQIVRGDGHVTGAPSGSADTHLTLGPGWSMAANTPFSLHKHWTHEGGISSPMIVHWPAGIIAKGELRTTPAHFVDIVPTILELAGIDPELEWKGVTAPAFPGQSLVPVFEQDPDWVDRELFFSHQGNEALRMGDWKVVRRNQNDWELYNIARDRVERNNLATRHTTRLEQMIEIWEKKNHQYTNIDRKLAGAIPVQEASPK